VASFTDTLGPPRTAITMDPPRHGARVLRLPPRRSRSRAHITPCRSSGRASPLGHLNAGPGMHRRVDGNLHGLFYKVLVDLISSVAARPSRSSRFCALASMEANIAVFRMFALRATSNFCRDSDASPRGSRVGNRVSFSLQVSRLRGPALIHADIGGFSE